MKSGAKRLFEAGVPVEIVGLANLVLLSLAAVVVKIFPSVGVWICNTFYPLPIPDGGDGSYMVYRISLYVVATLISIFMTVGIFWVGIMGWRAEMNGVSRWKKILFVLTVVPVLWVFYPAHALSEDYLVDGDIIYVLSTSLIFMCIQLLIFVASQKPRQRRYGDF